MIFVPLTEKEASALRRSMPRPYDPTTRTFATSKSHEREHARAVRKIRDAENGWGQGLYREARKNFERRECK